MSTRPWRRVSVPASVSAVPAMLSREECQYLLWLTSERYDGWGAVVDLGPWLGGSTAALAEGLRRRGKGGVVHSLDLFRWEPDYMGAVAAEPLAEGADFQHVFARHTAPWADFIRARQADLSRFEWDGGPIELLFVDAAKTWDLANAILAGFGDHLVPGRSRVVLQDFRYHETHWLPLIFDSQPAVWRQVEAVREGWTVTFELLQPLRTADGPHRTWSDADFPLEVAEPLLRRRMMTEHPDNATLFLRMLYRRVLVEGTPEQATRLRSQLLATGIDPRDLARTEDVAALLVPSGWQRYERGDYASALAIADRAIAGRVPAPIWALALRGMSLLKLGRLDAARPLIDEVVQRSPGLADPRMYQAELALASGDPAAAEASVREALALAAENPDSLLQWAIAILTQAWALEGPSPRHAAVLDDLRTRFGDLPILRPDSGTSRVERAEMGAMATGADGAAEATRRARALDAGWDAFNRGEYGHAEALAAELLEGIDVSPPWVLALLGMSRLRLGEPEDARPLLEEAASRLPAAADVCMYLAELELACDHPGLAEAHAVRALELGRDWSDTMLHWAMSLLGWIWWLESPHAPHDAILRRLDELHGGRMPLELLHAAEALLQGELAAATERINAVLARHPDHPDARRLQAEVAAAIEAR